MKILQFPIADSFGGITHYILENWKWIDREKFQFDFATMSKSLGFSDQILSAGSKIHCISCYAEENEKKFVEEVNRILDEGYDVVHLHTKQWKSFLIEKICMERNVPKVIVHAHSTRCDAEDFFIRKMERERHERVKKLFSASYATDFWACSEEAADWLFGKQIPADKIRIMKNAVEIEKFSYDEIKRNKIRQELGIKDNFVVGNVGRFVYQKNQKFLLEVFSKLCCVNNNAILLLVGDGPLENELKSMAVRYGISDRIKFLGKRKDVNELYQAMDLFVLPSHFEGFAIVLIEAQISGLKCIVSKNISLNANITGEVDYLDNAVEVWVRKIQEYAKGYYRKDKSVVTENKGYSIKQQILNVEAGYLGKDLYDRDL